MVRKSYGTRRGTRKKLKSKKGKGITRFLRKFEIGENVRIIIDASQKKMPFHRFHGTTGKVVGKRGRAYIIQVKEGKSIKTVITKPEHISKVE